MFQLHQVRGKKNHKLQVLFTEYHRLFKGWMPIDVDEYLSMASQDT